MYIFLTILIVIAAILLTLLVLVQNSKGGGLAAGFSSGNQVMGAPRTAIIAVLSIAGAGYTKGRNVNADQESQVQVEATAEQPAAEIPAEAE